MRSAYSKWRLFRRLIQPAIDAKSHTGWKDMKTTMNARLEVIEKMARKVFK